MIRINGKKKLLYTIILILLGVFINRLGANIVSVTGCPLYLDSIGTMIVAVVGGLAPGSTVGFITNMIGGFSDTSTFYYGLFNAVIAVIAGRAADKGFFDKLYKVFYLLPFFLLLSIPCSLLTYILYGFKIADNASMPIANILHSHGMSVLMSQTIADFCIELPDKLINGTTVGAMQSGSVYGHAACIDGMIERIWDDLGYKTAVVATGGFARTVIPNCKTDITIDSELLIKSLFILYQKNMKDFQSK